MASGTAIYLKYARIYRFHRLFHSSTSSTTFMDTWTPMTPGPTDYAYFWINRVYIDKRMLKMELPGKRERERFMEDSWV